MRESAWLTVGEAARFIGVSEPTLRKWTDEGRIAAFRTPGGHRRFLVGELIDFRRRREEHPNKSEGSEHSFRSTAGRP
jgi:excisionase family DNA binding protein